MAPLRFSLAAPCCQNQECRAPPSEKPLSAWSRCRVVLYCSRECQKRDVAAHKNNCVRAKQCYDLLAKEEAALRAMEPSELLPENVFETGVGDFYAIVPTRPYMLAKYELIRTMTGLPSCGAFERGLAECMDSLRLCRGDNLGVRGVVPTLLASLDRLQEAYDFIKWYETVPDDYNWGDPEAPFLTTKNAPMTESTEGFERCMSPFFLSTLTYIKFSVALMVVEVMSSLDNGGDPSRIVELSDGLRAALFPTGDVQPVTYADLAKLHEKMIQQSMELFVFTHRRNLWFWVYVLDPEKLAAEPEPPYHSLESKFYVNHGFSRMRCSGWSLRISSRPD